MIEYIFLISLIYVVVSRVIMRRFVNYNYLNEYREKMKEVNKRFAEATKKGDQKELERIHEFQKKEIIPMMPKILKEQFKSIFIIIVLFSVAIYVVNIMDTTKADDISFNLSKGESYSFSDLREGVYFLEVFDNGNRIGYLIFSVGSKDSTIGLVKEIKKDEIYVTLEKEKFEIGEEVVVQNKGKEVNILFDNGNSIFLYLGLPFLEFIKDSYFIFIFFVFINGLVYSFIEKKVKEFKKKSDRENKN